MAAEIKQTPLYQDANLQGYWRFEDNYSDESGNGYTLTPVNTPTFVTDLFGKGLDVEASSSQYASISLASAPNLNHTSDFTWTALFKPEAIGAALSIIGNTNSSVNQGLRLGVTAAGKLDLRSFKSGDDQSVTHTTTLVAGTRYRLTAVYRASGNTVDLFVGTGGSTTKVSDSYSRALVSSAGIFAVGRIGDFNSEYGDGVIDEVADFDRALTDAEVENLESATPTTTSTSTSSSTTTTSTSTSTTTTSTSSSTTTTTSTSSSTTTTSTSSTTSTSTTITVTTTSTTTTSTTTTSTSTTQTTTTSTSSSTTTTSTSTTVTYPYHFEVERKFN